MVKWFKRTNLIAPLNLYTQSKTESIHSWSKKFDQYSRHNNVVVDGIPSSMNKRERQRQRRERERERQREIQRDTETQRERELEGKCVYVFGKRNIKIDESHIEACHRLGKSSNTIILFVSTVNRKFCFLTKWPTKGKPDRNLLASKNGIIRSTKCESI